MAEEAKGKPTEYHVLRLYYDPAGVADADAEPIAPEGTGELWEIVATHTTTSSENAKKAYIAEHPADVGRTLVTVPTGNWKPQRPKVRPPVYDLEDA